MPVASVVPLIAWIVVGFWICLRAERIRGLGKYSRLLVLVGVVSFGYLVAEVLIELATHSELSLGALARQWKEGWALYFEAL